MTRTRKRSVLDVVGAQDPCRHCPATSQHRLDRLAQKAIATAVQAQTAGIETVTADRPGKLDISTTRSARTGAVARTDRTTRRRRGTARHRRRATLLASAAALIAALTMGTGVVTSGGHGGSTVRAGLVAVQPSARDIAVARSLLPLTADLDIDCEGVAVPVALLVRPGRAERGRGTADAALRSAIRADPWRAEEPLAKTGWLRLAAHKDTVLFGRRTGRIGVGTVLILKRDGSSYAPDRLGGCGPVVPIPGGTSALVYAATVHGKQLTARVDVDMTCLPHGGTVAATVVKRVLTTLTPDGMHLLVVQAPNPALPRTLAPGSCAADTKQLDVPVTLDRPLGTAVLFDDSRVPPSRIRLG